MDHYIGIGPGANRWIHFLKHFSVEGHPLGQNDCQKVKKLIKIISPKKIQGILPYRELVFSRPCPYVAIHLIRLGTLEVKV